MLRKSKESITWLNSALCSLEKSRLELIKYSLQKKQAEWESLCRQPEKVKKIKEIATGILRKNSRFVRQLEEVENRYKELSEKINHAKEQMKALEERIALNKINTRYRVTCSDILSNSKAASLIVDAITRKQFSSLLAPLGGVGKFM